MAGPVFSRFDFEAVCKPCLRGLAAMQACAAMHPVPPGHHRNGLTGACGIWWLGTLSRKAMFCHHSFIGYSMIQYFGAQKIFGDAGLPTPKHGINYFQRDNAVGEKKTVSKTNSGSRGIVFSARGDQTSNIPKSVRSWDPCWGPAACKIFPLGGRIVRGPKNLQTFSLTCPCDVNILPCKVANDLSHVHQHI